MTASSAQDFYVRTYVTEAMVDCSLDSIILVEQLRSGENHLVFHVSYRGPDGRTRDVIVRAGTGDEGERARAHREAAVMRKVGGVVGPELYDFRPDYPGFGGPIICMKFISGHQRELTEVRPDDMRRLGEVVQRLHALPVEDLREWESSNTGVAAYAEERWRAHLASRLSAIRDPLSDVLQRRLRAGVALVSDAMDQLAAGEASALDEGLVLLHADLSGANVIWSPRPVLIDWEYARVGDPADEIAYLFTQNDLGDSHRAAFWGGYRPQPMEATTDEILHRVRLWEPMTLLGSIMWWLDAWSRSLAARPAGPDPSLPKAPHYYLEQAIERLDRFERMFNSS